MVIGERLRELREGKKLSQGDIEKRCGLLRCYISRVENGHTVPSIQTLERLARAIEVPIYQFFYDGQKPPRLSGLPTSTSAEDHAWGSSGKDANVLRQFRKLLSRTNARDLKVLLLMAQKMARPKSVKTGLGHHV